MVATRNQLFNHIRFEPAARYEATRALQEFVYVANPVVATPCIHLFLLAGTFSSASISTSWPPIPGVPISYIRCSYTQVPYQNTITNFGERDCIYDVQGNLVLQGPGAFMSDVTYCLGEL